jgi:hypothetical protein
MAAPDSKTQDAQTRTTHTQSAPGRYQGAFAKKIGSADSPPPPPVPRWAPGPRSLSAGRGRAAAAGCLARAIGPCHPPARSRWYPTKQGNVSRQLAGAVVLGGGAAPAPTATPRGQRALLRFFNSTGVLKRAAPRPSAAVAGGLAGRGGSALRRLFPGGPGGGAKHVFSSSPKRAVAVDARPNVYISWHK